MLNGPGVLEAAGLHVCSEGPRNRAFQSSPLGLSPAPHSPHNIITHQRGPSPEINKGNSLSLTCLAPSAFRVNSLQEAPRPLGKEDFGWSNQSSRHESAAQGTLGSHASQTRHPHDAPTRRGELLCLPSAVARMGLCSLASPFQRQCLFLPQNMAHAG